MEHLLEPSFHLLDVRHIHLYGQATAAGGSNIGHQRGQFLFVTRGNRNFRANLSQRKRSIAANTLRCAGNQCNFIF